MTNLHSPEQSPATSAKDSGRWQVRVLLMILAAFAGALIAIVVPTFEPATAHDATVVSSKSNTTQRESGRRQTNWTTVLQLDDGRTVSSDAAPLGRGVDRGERVQIELTDFSDTVNAATWPGGEFSQSRAAALLVAAPMAAFVAFLLLIGLRQRWAQDRRNALIETGLAAAGFSIAAAWPFLT